MAQDPQAGWSAKVEAAYRRLGRELWALFYAHCCDAERAYDAVQESFLRLQEQNGTPIRDERAWLLHVGRNWLRDVARLKSSSTITTEHLDKLAVAPSDPGRRVMDEETRSLIRETLKHLRTDDREVLIMRYSLDWSSRRIAQALDSTPSAVDMRLSRARRRLGELLEQAGIDQ
jgi:RNA polymerase sigma-70 factor (ECF subfamily)